MILLQVEVVQLCNPVLYWAPSFLAKVPSLFLWCPSVPILFSAFWDIHSLSPILCSPRKSKAFCSLWFFFMSLYSVPLQGLDLDLGICRGICFIFLCSHGWQPTGLMAKVHKPCDLCPHVLTVKAYISWAHLGQCWGNHLTDHSFQSHSSFYLFGRFYGILYTVLKYAHLALFYLYFSISCYLLIFF